jgi:hypothetical protein
MSTVTPAGPTGQTDQSERADGPDPRATALDHSWKWFSYHAEQRLTAFNYYLIIVGVLVVGFFKCVEEGWWLIGAVVAAFGTAVSLAFWLLDIRNTELVNYGREELERFEPKFGLHIRERDKSRKALWAAMGRPSRLLFRLGKDVAVKDGSMPDWLTKHQTWLRIILWCGLISFAVAVIFSLLNSVGLGPEWTSSKVRVTRESMLRHVDRMIVELTRLNAVSQESPTQGSARVVRDTSRTVLVLAQNLASDCRVQAHNEDACKELRRWVTTSTPALEQLAAYDINAPQPKSPADLAKGIEAGMLDGVVDSLRGKLRGR